MCRPISDGGIIHDISDEKMRVVRYGLRARGGVGTLRVLHQRTCAGTHASGGVGRPRRVRWVVR